MTSGVKVGHTGEVEKKSTYVTERVWQIVPIFLVVLVQSWQGYLGGGLKGIGWLYLGWLVVGWVVGWLLAELDHVFYSLMNNPQELTSRRVRSGLLNKNFREVWSLLNDTLEERVKLPIRNILTTFVIMVLGIWMATSGVNPFGVGLAYGLGIRLVSEILREADWRKWYWVFAREFSEKEHRIIVVCLVGLLIVQTWFLWR